MWRASASTGYQHRPHYVTGGVSRSGAGTLWTCTRCNRNNEARLDACHYCRSRPPAATSSGVAVGSTRNSQTISRSTISGNPFQRYVSNNRGGSERSSGTAVAPTPAPAPARPVVGRGQRTLVGSASRQQQNCTSTAVETQRDEGDADAEADGAFVNQNVAGSFTDDSFLEVCPGSYSRGGGSGGGGRVRSTSGAGEGDAGSGHSRNQHTSPSATRQQYQLARHPRANTAAAAAAAAAAAPLPPLPRVPIDTEAAKTWIYPVNYAVREYQVQIVTQALFKNTLVALPTGLGKTLIAAVVMYNYYRWFPQGKVVFLAPTKPLVAQQISACYDIMGVPESDTAELQGSVAPEKRRKLWDERRVFYCTPQSMANDIKQKRCDPGRFVCVVVDEAHRGTGNYAYVNVIRAVAASTSHFRVLALSATPGSDIKTIQQVLENLRISNIECRSEDDPEVARHTHARQVEVVKCKLGSHIDAIRQGLVGVLQPLVTRMVNKRVLYTRDPMALKAWTVIQCLHKFRATAQENGQAYMAGEVESEMGILTKVVQAKDTLVTHGAAGCLQKLAGMEFEVNRRGFRSGAERSVMQHPEWAGLMKLLRQTAENTAGVSTKHPKLIKLKEVLREHFARHEGAGKSTRAIVFTHLRDSVEEITEFLAGEELLRVKAFIGQGNSAGAKARAAAATASMKEGGQRTVVDEEGDEGYGGGDGDEEEALPKQRLKGQTQKEQKAVVQAFFSGEFNCLVATCIAEEGLDIGEVDLIVSFDALNSPVRMVQRMGRTGRKRAGKVVVLVTEGSEESKLRNSNNKSKSITKALQTRKDKFELFQGDDIMVPPGPRPRMVKQEMVIVEYHLSQVGGHQRKANRKGVGSGSSGGGGNGHGCYNWDDWRLSPAQKTTLAEAYSDEPGTKPYVPDASTGWKHQKSPWSTGKVARSARSRLLCEMKAFVTHQEWELLYDPDDMQLAMKNWQQQQDDDETAPPLSIGRARDKSRASNAGAAAVSADIISLSSRYNGSEITEGDGASCGGGSDGGGGRNILPVEDDESDDDVFEVYTTAGRKQKKQHLGCGSGNGGSSGANQQENQVGRKKQQQQQPEDRPSPQGTKKALSRTKRKSDKGDGEGRKDDGAVDGNIDKEEDKDGLDMDIGDGWMQTEDSNANGNNEDDDEETQSDPECRLRRPANRSRVSVFSEGAHKSSGEGDNSCEASKLDVAPTGRWRCACGCVVKVGRASCRLCGGAATIAVSPPCNGEFARAKENTETPPPSAGKVLLTLGSPLACGSVCSNDEPIDNGGSGGHEVIVRDCPAKHTRWQCGCGCQMKAGGKRCVMCGQSRPRGYSVSAIGQSTVEGGGALTGPTGTSARVSARNDTPVASGSGGGRWQCTACGSEYGPARPKCRACGTPRTAGPGVVAAAGDTGDTPEPSSENAQHADTCGTANRDSGAMGRAATAPKPEARPRSRGRENDGRAAVGDCGEMVTERNLCAGHEQPASPELRRLSLANGRDRSGVAGDGVCGGQHRIPESPASVGKTESPTVGRGIGARSGSTADSASPPPPLGQGSQEDDGLAYMFPSLHRFEAEETGGSIRSDNGGRKSGSDYLPVDMTSKSGSKVDSAGNVHTTLSSPLIASPPPRLLSMPPKLAGARAHRAPKLIMPGERSSPVVPSPSDGSGLLLPPPPVFTAAPSSMQHSQDAEPVAVRRVGSPARLAAQQVESALENGYSADTYSSTPAAISKDGASLPVQKNCRNKIAELSPQVALEVGTVNEIRTGHDSLKCEPALGLSLGPGSSSPSPIAGVAPSTTFHEPALPAAAATQDVSDTLTLPAAAHMPPHTAGFVTESESLTSNNQVVQREDDRSSVVGTKEQRTASAVAAVDGNESLGNTPEVQLEPNGQEEEWDDGAEEAFLFAEADYYQHSSASSTGGNANNIQTSVGGSGGCPAEKEHAAGGRKGVAAGCDDIRTVAEGNANVRLAADRNGGGDGDGDPATSSDEDEQVGSSRSKSKCNGGEKGMNSDDERQRLGKGRVERWKGSKDGDRISSSGNSGSGGNGANGSPEPHNDAAEDDIYCGVCGSASSKEDDPIILCDGEGCRTAVHADCYGVGQVPEGSWLCEPCLSEPELHPSPALLSSSSSFSTQTTTTVAAVAASQKDNRKKRRGASSVSSRTFCALCRRSGGALKLSQCGQWAHVVCVWWTPELASHPETARPGSLSTLDPDRASLTCSSCHDRGGAAVQCAVLSCLEACHPFCAMRAGLLLREDDGAFKLFCRTHSRRERMLGVTAEKEGTTSATKQLRSGDEGAVGVVVERVTSAAAVPSTATADVAATTTTTTVVKKHKTLGGGGVGGGGNDTAIAAGALLKPALLTTVKIPQNAGEEATGEGVKNGEDESELERNGDEEAGEDGQGLLLAAFSQTQGPRVLPPRRPLGGERVGRLPLRKQGFISDSDDEVDEKEKHEATNVVDSRNQSAAIKGRPGSGAAASPIEATRAMGNSDTTSSGTPLKVFNMAPPIRPAQLSPSASKRSSALSMSAACSSHHQQLQCSKDKNAGEAVPGAPIPQSSLLLTPSRRNRDGVGSASCPNGNGRNRDDGSPAVLSCTLADSCRSPSLRSCDNGDAGDDSDGGLVTLSQAVSPLDGGRQGEGQELKRRRLRKTVERNEGLDGGETSESNGKKRLLGRRSNQKSSSKEPSQKIIRRSDSGSGMTNSSSGTGKTQGKNRGRVCDFDRASYRRYIDTEAEVDDDVSDDDEAALDDQYYDSQDSFVNDGPLSYETSSSQDGDTPSRHSETLRDDDDRRESDEECDSDDKGEGKDKKRKGIGRRKRRFRDDDDEKGMYLQLLAQSQPLGRHHPSPRRRNVNYVLDGRGGGGGGRGNGRFAFVNAVMRHARDGGNALDVEDACGSDIGYAESSQQTPIQGMRDGMSPGEETLEEEGMYSVASSRLSNGHLSDAEQDDAQPMYSQALKQAHPGSPSPSSPDFKEQKPASRWRAGAGVVGAGDNSAGKENGRPSTTENRVMTQRPALRPMVLPEQIHPCGTSSGSVEKVAPAATVAATAGEAVRGAKEKQNLAGDKLCRSDGVSSGVMRSRKNFGGSSSESSTQPSGGSGTGAPLAGGGGGASLTDEQRHQMETNRAKALARLKLSQAAKNGTQVKGVKDFSSGRAPSGPAADDISGNGDGSLSGGNTSFKGGEENSKDASEIAAAMVTAPSQAATLSATATMAIPRKPGLKRPRLSLLRSKPPSYVPPPNRATNPYAAAIPATAGRWSGGVMSQQEPGTRAATGGHSQQATSQNTVYQRERFRMTMDMDMDSDEEEDSETEIGSSRKTVFGSAAPHRAMRGTIAHGGDRRNASAFSPASEGPTATPSISAAATTATTGVAARTAAVGKQGFAKAGVFSQGTNRTASASVSATPQDNLNNGKGVGELQRTSQFGNITRSATADVTTLPLSAPRAGALESLARELRSRAGMTVHASPLGGGLRDVDIVAGAQCAICVRSRRQFISQTHASCSSPSRPRPPPSQGDSNLQQSRTGAGAAAVAAPPLVALLQASLQRYVRVVVIIEGLESGGGDGGEGSHEERAAMGAVDVLRGVSVITSSGWKETANKVVELVAREARAGVGLPREVTGPSLTAAQGKFLSFLLKAPTLSYGGGLFLLQAFRGRSVKDVISSAAREFQAAVPGMTGQQAAKLKRFLVNGGGSPRRSKVLIPSATPTGSGGRRVEKK